MANREITTIQIDKPTKEKLKQLGEKGDTFNDIINKLINNGKHHE
jgi:predicted CopG family antitoxin